MNPKSNQEVGGEPNQFPADEEQKETVRDDHAQHGGGEKREVGEEAGKILVRRHIADAENKNAQADEGDHDQHGGRERIEHEADPQHLFAKSEPGEILPDTIGGRLQRGPKSDERENESNHLSGDREHSRTAAARIRQAQNQERCRQRHRRDQPEVSEE